MSVADPRVAVRAALAAHLSANLAGVQVSQNWPTPGKPLAMPAVTVLASPQVVTEYHARRIWRTLPSSNSSSTAPKVDVLYSYGRATLNLQLDAWEAFEAKRDALAARVEALTNLDPLVTLGAPGAPTDLRSAPGLVLRVSGYYGALCEFIFEPVAGKLPETSDVAQVGEWRQAWSGRAFLYLLNEETVAQMRSVSVRLGLNGETPSPIVTIP